MSSNDGTAGDADLVAALPHDVAAFETFYRRHVEQVAAYAARRCPNADDVADVVALTFVRLLDVAGNFDPARGEPRAFLFGIAANVVREVRRKRRRHEAVVWKLAARDLLDADDIERIEARIDAESAAVEVHDALLEVPAGEQQMLRLVADGMTPGQASQALGISAPAGWARLSRARRRVRSHVAERARSTRDTATTTDATTGDHHGN